MQAPGGSVLGGQRWGVLVTILGATQVHIRPSRFGWTKSLWEKASPWPQRPGPRATSALPARP